MDMHRRNDPSPKRLYGVPVHATTGAGYASGVATYYITGGTRVLTTNSAVHVSGGVWSYTPTQAEGNVNEFAIQFYVATAYGYGPVVRSVAQHTIIRPEVERLFGVRNWPIYGSAELFAAEAGDNGYATWPNSIVWDAANSYRVLYYTASDGSKNCIRRRTSADGKTAWSAGTTVIAAGGAGTWNEGGVWCGNGWLEGTTWYMLVTGRTADLSETAVGLYTSADGITWTENAGNPVFQPADAWEHSHVEVTGIIKDDTTENYVMFYTTLPTVAQKATNPLYARKIGRAVSADCVTWVRDSTPAFGDSDSGFNWQPYHGYYSGYPFKNGTNGFWYLIVAVYGANADYSYFELWECADLTFAPAKRRRVGVIMTTDDYDFPSQEVDIVCIEADSIYRKTYASTSNEIRMYFGAKNSSDGTWRLGLATQPSMKESLRWTPCSHDKLVPFLPRTRWEKAAEEFETYDGYTLPQMIAASAAVIAGDPTIAGTSVTWILPGGTVVSVGGTVTTAGDRSSVTWSFA